jgi:hypothetical protein
MVYEAVDVVTVIPKTEVPHAKRKVRRVARNIMADLVL